jgi:L-malate glycosyltransferase
VRRRGPRRERTLVVGGYGYGNVGDEAILAGLLARLGTDDVVVLSRDPDETAHLHGVRAVGIRQALFALRDCRNVLIGGGGLFGRDMGLVGRTLPVVGLAARALGRQILVEGVDLDDRLSPTARRLVPALLRRAERVTLRDRRSIEIARGWGVRAELVADLSDAMPAAPLEAGIGLLERAGVDTDRPVVGLALAAVRPALWARTRRGVAAAMDAMPDVQFCFVPMSRHPSVRSHDDLRAAYELQAGQPRLRIIEERAHPATVLAAFGALDAIVAMRYHAMLFADRAGIPLMAVPYAEKNLRWLSDRGRDAIAPPASVQTLREALNERPAEPIPMRVAS